jgi:hypothetical protein
MFSVDGLYQVVFEDITDTAKKGRYVSPPLSSVPFFSLGLFAYQLCDSALSYSTFLRTSGSLRSHSTASSTGQLYITLSSLAPSLGLMVPLSETGIHLK